MGHLSLWSSRVLLGSILQPGQYPLPETLYVALTLSIPDRNATGETLSEPTGASYTRMVYGVGSDYWTVGQTTFSNVSSLSWPHPTEDWGRIVGWALCTEATGGDVVAAGALRPEATIVTGSNVVLPEGALRLRVV